MLKHILREDLRWQLPGILALLREVADQTTGLEYLETILRYLSVATDKISGEDFAKQ